MKMPKLSIKEHPLLLLMYFLSALSQAQTQSFDISFNVDEEVPVNTVVGNVGRDSKLFQLLSSEDFEALRYSVLRYEDSSNNFFTIDRKTGVLKTAALIDRELICFYETKCKLHLHVAAQSESGNQFYTFKVTVNVVDINDHSPIFSVPSMHYKLDEDAAVSTSINIQSASDRDIGNNTIQRYTLATTNDVFGLKVSRNLDESLVPQLYVKAPMDRERQPHYFLKVIALDGGNPRRSGELTINVTLNDVNDNAPRFSKQIYDESVPETSAVGHRVMTLSASDEDLGNNGRVSFRLGARQSEEAFNTFRVAASSGDILTLRDLTPLQGQTLRLVVEAVDQGAKPQTAQAMVNIHIVDTINNSPAIRMTIPPGSPVSRITESASPGFVVAHFIVEDTDSGQNGAVTCRLQDDVFGLQRLKESEYKVTVYTQLDREAKPYYDVIITCVDGGSPSLTSTASFAVVLEDANDNPPKFIKTLYRANISENLNTFILRVEASDLDLGQNSTITYKLGDVTPLVASHIQVNPSTGELNTKQMLDRELFRQLDFYVVAADGGTPSLSASARVIIDVIDQNDNIPRVPNGYFMSVPENRPVGTLIGNINAIDPDEGSSGQIGYQLRPDNDATKLFNVSQTGEVRTLKVFDREAISLYNIDVLAWDFGANPHTNDLHIRIVVADANDHTPVFEFPRAENKTIHMTLDTRFNSTVASLFATDKDAGENATLTYTIIEGATDAFEIEPHSGRIFTTRTLQARDKGTYNMELFVRDNGLPPLSTTGSLVVIVAQGNATAAITGLGSNEHIIVVTILVGVIILIAIVVLLVVVRFLRKGGRRRTKYSGGLPLEVSIRAQICEDNASGDEEPWNRYDNGKNVNGPLKATDAMYGVNDDVVTFKMKMGDQYMELEPEDKDPSYYGAQPHDDDNSNRNSVISDVDGVPGMTRDKSMTRLATFQSRTTVVQMAGNDPRDKVWRSPKTDEILSSSSRDTTGADSGRGQSEDGSSVTADDSGYPVSPNHMRGYPGKHPGNFPRPIGYDRGPPLLMTFPTTPDHMSGGMGFGSRQNLASLGNPYSQAPTIRHCHSYSNLPISNADLFNMMGQDMPVHRSNFDLTSDMGGHRGGGGGPNQRVFHPGNSGGDAGMRRNAGNQRGRRSSGQGGGGGGEGEDDDRGGGGGGGGIGGISDIIMHPSGQWIDMRLCSEPPQRMKGGKMMLSYDKCGIQETPQLTSNAMHASCSRLVYVDAPYMDRSPRGNNQGYVYPPPSMYLQACPNPSNFRQASCPQLFDEATLFELNSQYQMQPVQSPSRSRSFYQDPNEPGMTLPTMPSHDVRTEEHEDGNTTTSGSYTIEPEDMATEPPQADSFV